MKRPPPKGCRGYRIEGATGPVYILEVPRQCAGEEKLSAGERAVVALARQGLSNQEIAKARGTSPRTVANQLASAYRKLGIDGRAGLR